MRDNKNIIQNQNLVKKICSLKRNEFENTLRKKLKVKIHHQGMYIETEKLPEKINHQGIFIEAEKLSEKNIFEFLEQNKEKEYSKIVILDHVVDSGNIGSIIRICVGLEVDLLVLTKDHCPDFQNPVIAKISSGTLEHLDIAVVTNLASTIDLLKKNDFWVYGLSLNHKEKQSIYDVKFSKKSAIIMGNEDKGLRKLTNEKIDIATYIPISEKVDSLNVSSALGITVFEISRQQKGS